MDEYKKATEIFNKDYPYYSSHSPGNVSRAKEYVEMMCQRFSPKKVLEVGSNDGYLLQHFPKNIEVCGIDPARGAREIAVGKGIPTYLGFFGTDFIYEVGMDGQWDGPFDLVCGSNVLAHNPNLNDFVEGIRIALKPDGVVTIEYPHLLNLLNGTCQFDTIYHEHYSYLSFTTVCELFKRHGMEVFDVAMTPEQGGSIMVFAQREFGKPVTPNVTGLLQQELEYGMSSLERYQGFQGRVENTKRTLLTFLISKKNRGESVVAYGASCKCNTLLNFCGIRPDLIKFVVDKSPLKQGKYLPGSHLKICDENALKRERPDYVIITAWNLKDEIMEQLNYIREWDGCFVMTTPSLEVL